jgi:hypothetical protein
MSFKDTLRSAAATFVKNEPKIFFFVGLGMVVGGTIGIAVQSTKVKEVIVEDTKKIKEVRTKKDDIPQQEYGRELAKSYGGLGWTLVKHYALPASIEALGLFLMFKGYKVLDERYLTATAAAIALKMENERLNMNMIEHLGEEKAADIRRGIETVEVVETNDKGKVKKKKVKVYDKNKFFNTTERRYSESGHYHEVFSSDGNAMNDNINELKIFQVYANQFLAASKTGTCTLNDIYRILDFTETAWGDAFIWEYDPEHPDDHIKFGIDNLLDPATREWYLKQNDDIWLTFNCDRVTFEDPNDIFKLAPNGKIARGTRDVVTVDSL